jgi:hypothetical protein
MEQGQTHLTEAGAKAQRNLGNPNEKITGDVQGN